MEKFWMVHGGYKTHGVVRHESLDLAVGEAQRLCQKHGVEFYVLEAVKIIRTSKPPIEVIDLI